MTLLFGVPVVAVGTIAPETETSGSAMTEAVISGGRRVWGLTPGPVI